MHELTITAIQSKIINLPNRPPFMLAQDVAIVYDSTSKSVHQAVQRNPNRFPEDFAFRLTAEEISRLQNEAANHRLALANTRTAPLAFTRFGANQISTVLKTEVAAKRSVQIIRAFSMLEERLASAPEHVESAAPAVPADCMLITKDEYIEMKQIEVDHYKNLYNSQLPKPRRVSRPLLDVDIAAILDLKAQGLSHQEIADKVERSTATIHYVCRCREDN